MSSADTVRHIANLARIRFTEAELAAFPAQFDAILAFVGTLNEVPTDGVAPARQLTGVSSVLRDDEAPRGEAEPDRTLLTGQAPAREGSQVKVKAVFE